MPNQGDVTGIIVEPSAVGPGVAVAKDSTVVTKSLETIEADKIERAAAVLAAEVRSASQVRVNLIWEYTQAAIAGITVLSNVVYIFVLLFVPNPNAHAVTAASLLSNGFFLVIGFYFGRTNHQREGGTGTHGPLQQSGR